MPKELPDDHASGQGQKALPPWLTDDPEQIAAWRKDLKQRETEAAFTEYRAARAKLELLAPSVRRAGFDYWLDRYVVTVDDPREWTQAQTLYESYLKHARTVCDKEASVHELATVTLWGRMMATQFGKKRRGSGWHYPLRLKKGA